MTTFEVPDPHKRLRLSKTERAELSRLALCAQIAEKLPHMSYEQINAVNAHVDALRGVEDGS